MESVQKKLIDFLQELQALPGQVQIAGLQLVHCTDEGNSPLRPFALDPARTDCAALALDILSVALDHIEAFTLPQRYNLVAYAAGSATHIASAVFVLRPTRTTRQMLGSVTEAPTEKGLIAQLMRHCEAAYASNVDLSRTVASMYQSRAEVAETSFHRYVQEREKWATYSAEEVRGAHLRKMEETEAAREHEIVMAAFDEMKPVFKALGPHITRKLAAVLAGEPSSGATRKSAPQAQGAPPKETPSAPTSEGDEREEDAPSRSDDRRAALEKVLESITDEETAKLEDVLGAEKAQELVRAVVGMLV